MTNQGGVQQAVRDLTGTALDYNGDWSALFDQDGIPAGDWNGRLLAWINQTLGTSYTNLPGAMQAFAVEQGFNNWSSMNTFEVGFDFFVDSVNGSDENDGTSEEQALQSISALSTAIGSSSGLRIGLKYGSSWEERLSLTSDNHGTRFDAYGDPEDGLPEFRCDSVIDPGDFAVAEGRTDVYVVQWAVEPSTLAADIPRVWEDGEALSFSAVDLSANEGKPGTYWHDDPTDLSTVDLYIHPYGSTDPRVDGKEYRASTRRQGLDTYDAENCLIRNIKGRRNYSSYGSIAVGRGGRAQRCEMHEGNTHNIYVRPGASSTGATAVLEDCLARDAYGGWTEAGPTLYICHENPAPTVAATLYRRCRAELTYNCRLPTTPITGITQANPAVVTAAGHGLANGDIIVISDVVGMTEVNGQRYVVASVTTDTFALQEVSEFGSAVNVNSTGFGEYSSGGVVRLFAFDANTIGFYAHTDGVSVIDTVTYEDCETEGCGNPFAGADTDLTVVNGGTIETFSLGFQCAGDANVTGLIANNTPAILGATVGRTSAVDTVWNFDEVDFTLNSTGNFRIINTGCTIRVTNSRLVGFNVIALGNVADMTWELTGNDYVPLSRQFNPYNIGSSATGLTFTSDFNDFNGESDNIIYLGTTYALFAEYQSASGQDANSTP